MIANGSFFLSLDVVNLLYSDLAAGVISENVLLTVPFERGSVVAIRAFPRFDAHVGVLQSNVLVQPLFRGNGLTAVGTLVASAAGTKIAAAESASAESATESGRPFPDGHSAEAAEKAAQGGGNYAHITTSSTAALQRGRKVVGGDERGVDEGVEGST